MIRYWFGLNHNCYQARRTGALPIQLMRKWSYYHRWQTGTDFQSNFYGAWGPVRKAEGTCATSWPARTVRPGRWGRSRAGHLCCFAHAAPGSASHYKPNRTTSAKGCLNSPITPPISALAIMEGKISKRFRRKRENVNEKGTKRKDSSTAESEYVIQKKENPNNFC